MAYIVTGSETCQSINDPINMVEIFENANYEDYWDLAPEGTGLEDCSEDEDLFDWEANCARFSTGFEYSIGQA